MKLSPSSLCIAGRMGPKVPLVGLAVFSHFSESSFKTFITLCAFLFVMHPGHRGFYVMYKCKSHGVAKGNPGEIALEYSSLQSNCLPAPKLPSEV